MTRMSRQGKIRNTSPRKHKKPQPKTGPKQDDLPGGFKKHANAVSGDLSKAVFIPKI